MRARLQLDATLNARSTTRSRASTLPSQKRVSAAKSASEHGVTEALRQLCPAQGLAGLDLAACYVER